MAENGVCKSDPRTAGEVPGAINNPSCSRKVFINSHAKDSHNKRPKILIMNIFEVTLQ